MEYADITGGITEEIKTAVDKWLKATQEFAEMCDDISEGDGIEGIIIQLVDDAEGDTPDRYCQTLPDGSCVSDDPRDIHNVDIVIRYPDGSCDSDDPRDIHNKEPEK